MGEKLPQKRRHLETTEKAPSMEGSPVVESMPIEYTGVLVKVTFPRPNSIAKIFMLVKEPVSEGGVENYTKMLEEIPEEGREVAEDTFEIMNSTLVFRGPEEAQRWFDLVSYNYEPAKRREIADFLEVEDKRE